MLYYYYYYCCCYTLIINFIIFSSNNNNSNNNSNNNNNNNNNNYYYYYYYYHYYYYYYNKIIIIIIIIIIIYIGALKGCESAVCACCRFLTFMQEGHVIAKLYFTNAFNCIHRDALLNAVFTKVPEIYSFCNITYRGTSILRF